jgi:hypothetical protein
LLLLDTRFVLGSLCDGTLKIKKRFQTIDIERFNRLGEWFTSASALRT